MGTLNSLVLGLAPRVLLEEFEGGDLALPFSGVALYGYDAFPECYTSVWADTMSTAMMNSRGKYEEARDLVNFESQYSDPWTGAQEKCHGVTRFLENEAHVLEVRVAGPDQKEFKMLEITYTRKRTKEEK